MPKVSWWRISFQNGETAKLQESVDGEHISQGPVTAELEDELAKALNVSHAVVTTSGSTALLLALMALGIGKGDEVIVPDRGRVASAHAVAMAGVKVVLVDVPARCAAHRRSEDRTAHHAKDQGDHARSPQRTGRGHEIDRRDSRASRPVRS